MRTHYDFTGGVRGKYVKCGKIPCECQKCFKCLECNYPVAHPNQLCGECACEDDCAPD